jgi:hypothetical protein
VRFLKSINIANRLLDNHVTPSGSMVPLRINGD